MSEIKSFPSDFLSNIHYYSPRLLKKLGGMLTTPVTVVEAPFGYGKTTAVRDYLRDNLPEDIHLFWWSAEEGAPETSWVRLCREFARIDTEAGKELCALGFPKPISSWEIAQLIAGMRCDTPSVLVLDDFQFLQQELPRTVMSALLSYSGANLHLVIITQTTRPFLRSYFEQMGVHYIRTDDLRLHVNDIYRYCKLYGMTISKSEAKELYRYTEGWIMALYLTVLQMQRGEGIAPGLGIIRLMESIVWENMSSQGKKLLLQLALFSGVTIEQIGFLFQDDPLPENVFDLLEETPFIRYESSERRYVPHAILREMLLRRLEALDTQTKTGYYSRAGAWYARMGETEHALSCFFKAGDYESILSLPLNKLRLTRVDGVPGHRKNGTNPQTGG